MDLPNGSSGPRPPGTGVPEHTQALAPAEPSEAPPPSPRTQMLPSSPRTEALPSTPRIEVLPPPPRTEALPSTPRIEVLSPPPRTEALPSQRIESAPPPSAGIPEAPVGTGTQALPTGPRTQVLVPSEAPTPSPTPGRIAPEALTPIDVPEEQLAGELGPGERVRQYELIRRLGRGGMGEVFLARDTKLGRRVAIKFLRTQNPALVERFVVEARATARCSHENIVTLFEADTHQGRPYMVLEYLQGRTLAELVGSKAVPPGRAVELMSPVLRALAFAHGEGIVHRDLKPENVMLTSAGVMKVLDFGIAKVQEEQRSTPAELLGRAVAAVPLPGAPPTRPEPGSSSDTPLTEHGVMVGTMLYMSPEQLTAEAIDHRSDIWAVGIMLYQLLAGRHPLDGLDQRRLGRAVVGPEPMPSLRRAAPGVPSRLADAVDACLVKDPAKRPQDALRVLELLAPFMPGRRQRELEADESPYAGLGAFQESNSDLFFGRTHEVAALVHRLRDEPIVAVVGPSGVGKSSFVRAGVVPALKRLGESWEAIVVRPGRDPLAALASALVPTAATAGGGSVTDEVREARELQAKLAAEPGWAGSMLRTYARRRGRRVLVFVDQLEELFTLAPDAERSVFSACLAGVADDATSPVRVVMSVRSDFLDRLYEDARLAEARPGLFFLATPGDEALRDALALPAEVAGYRFESPAMLDEMVRDLRSTDGALSLLQFAATQLWEARNPVHKVLTRASYDAIGGIAGALARYADRVLAELSSDARRAARDLFLRLVTHERTRAIVSLEELQEHFQDRLVFSRLVDQLVQSRLLVAQKSERGTTIEIVHESLIRSWPALRRWLDESGEDASFLEQLRAGARQWDSGGRRRGLLWRGETADEAGRFQRRYRGQLPEAQRAFLDAVVTQATRSARLRRTLIAGGIGALLVVVAASMVALVVIRNAQQEAVRQAEIARTAAITAQKAEATARTAEAAARERAEALAVKERERAEAATRAEAASAELQVKNQELVGALENTMRAEALAKENAARAHASAAQARREQERADAAARQLAVQLRQEQERVKRLKEQFGSPLAETLPP